MKVLELFAGSRSIGTVAEKYGCDVFSVDINPFDGIDLAIDIEDLVVGDIPFIPDMVWASPPCTSYSVAGISHHRNGPQPKSDFANKSDRLVCRVLDIIKVYQRAEKYVSWYIENPVGMLRKMPFMQEIPKVTVTYCSYGDTRMKPTDIWSNNIYSLFNPTGWNPRKKCFNGNPNCHHERAPRGSRTGTQGLKGNYERSKIPAQLVNEIIKHEHEHRNPTRSDN